MLDNLTSKQKKIFIIIVCIVVIIAVYFIYKNTGNNVYVNNEEEFLNLSNVNNKENNEVVSKEISDEDKIIIHVDGEVQSPGVVTLKDGSRLEDAIKLSGGLTDYADISKVNLAYVLEDGMKIVIPKKDSLENLTNIISTDLGDGIIVEEESKNDKKNKVININKASQSELESLSGVGPSLANKIIEYRKNKGKFSSIEEIKNVTGIGNTKYEAIKNYICV